MTKFIQKSIVVGELDVVSQLCSHVNNCNIQDTESNRNAGQGGGPGLQPPGHRLRAAVPVPVAWTHTEENIYSPLKNICYSQLYSMSPDTGCLQLAGTDFLTLM